MTIVRRTALPTLALTGRRLALAAAIAACCTLCAGGIILSSTASAAESVLFNISGRGFGHGIGMSQYGACGYARHGWTYRQILAHYYSGISFGRVANARVRVLLADGQSSARVSAATSFRVVAGSRKVTVPGNTRAVVTYTAAGTYKIVAGTRTWTFSQPVLLVPGKSRLRLANTNQNGWSTSANVHYRGSLRVVHFTGGLSVINVLTLENYLRGVVPREMPASWPAAALRAQAVAARSYAAQRIGSSGAFDLYCTARSQVYNGADGEATTTNAAVSATSGVVPTYRGKPISAYYFSTSGGFTESIQNVWGTSPVPYLKGVADPYDSISPYHLWPDNPIRSSAATVSSALGASYSPAGTLQTIVVTKRGVSPRVVTAYAIGASGVRELSGSLLRARLRLRDTWFTVRTLSVAPSSRPRTTITYGSSIVLSGRTFPGLGSNQRLQLFTRVGSGAWTPKYVPATSIKPGAVALPGGRRATFSSYAATARPTALTTYYFALGKARSPLTSIAVRPILRLAASTSTPTAGEEVTFTGTVTPASLAGTTVTLQWFDGTTWATLSTAVLGTGGTASLTWVPPAEGSFLVRLRIPAAKGMAAALSEEIPLTVAAAASPSPSPSP